FAIGERSAAALRMPTLLPIGLSPWLHSEQASFYEAAEPRAPSPLKNSSLPLSPPPWQTMRSSSPSTYRNSLLRLAAPITSFRARQATLPKQARLSCSILNQG